MGVVPTSRGFAFRVRPDDQAEATTALVPELAEQLGPALGLQPNSTWLLRNVPRRILKQDLIKLLASEAGLWTACHALPTYAVNDRRATGSTWIVEAEEPPPRRAFRARGTCVTIERYTDERTLSPACRVWAKPISQWEEAAKRVTNSRNVRTPWGDIVDDDIDVDFVGGAHGNTRNAEDEIHNQCNQWNTSNEQSQQQNQQPQQSCHPQRTSRVPQQGTFPMGAPQRRTPYTMGDALAVADVQRRPRAFHLTDSSGTDSSAPPKHKKRFGEASRRTSPTAHWSASGDYDHEQEAMREALKAKDDQIAALQASMTKLQSMMETVMAAMASSGAISTQTVAATVVEVHQAAMPV